MSDHYYTNQPQSEHKVKKIKVAVDKVELALKTDTGVFSKDKVDFGSKLLISTFSQYARLDEKSQVLELGSGYGPILLALAKQYPAARFTGVELNQRAADLARENSTLNRITSIEWVNADATTLAVSPEYDYVVTNPPIRAGKAVIQAFVRKAHDALQDQGELWLVIQKKQGAPSMSAYMEELFGDVEMMVRDKGYWILRSVKESSIV